MNIIESIYNEPENWHSTESFLEHKNGAKLWTANGPWFCEPYPGGGFNIFNRFKAWRAFRWWVINAPIESFATK